MMRILLPLVVLVGATASAAAEPPKVLATGLDDPRLVALGPGSKILVTVGPSQNQGYGAVMLIEQGKAVPFATGLDQPFGLAAHQRWMFVVDKGGVWQIDAKGQKKELAPISAFPTTPHQLVGIAIDPESGTIYVCDHGDKNEKATGAIYRISPQRKVSLVASAKDLPQISGPSRLLLDGQSHLLIASSQTDELHRLNLSNASVEKVAGGFGRITGLAWDRNGRLFVQDTSNRRISAIARPGADPTTLFEIVKREGILGGLALDASGENLLAIRISVDDSSLLSIPISIPGWEVDDTPMPLQSAVAFPDL